MISYTDIQQVRAEMDARYASRSPRRRVRRGSSIEIIRRAMLRRSAQELHPGRANSEW